MTQMGLHWSKSISLKVTDPLWVFDEFGARLSWKFRSELMTQ